MQGRKPGHWHRLIEWSSSWLPRTQMQWGALAILAAFICLVVGGMVSWRSMIQRRDDTS